MKKIAKKVNCNKQGVSLDKKDFLSSEAFWKGENVLNFSKNNLALKSIIVVESSRVTVEGRKRGVKTNGRHGDELSVIFFRLKSTVSRIRTSPESFGCFGERLFRQKIHSRESFNEKKSQNRSWFEVTISVGVVEMDLLSVERLETFSLSRQLRAEKKNSTQKYDEC